MMNLLAGVFGGFAMFIGGLFGHHAPPGDMASSTPPGDHTGTTTPWGDRGQGMGSTTPGSGRSMSGVMGQVTSITGTTLIVVGHGSGMDSATTTYSVDASSAKVLKTGTKGVASSTPSSLSDIAIGDNVLVVGPISGTSVTATTIIDGFLNQMGMGGMMQHSGQGGQGRKGAPPAPQQ